MIVVVVVLLFLCVLAYMKIIAIINVQNMFICILLQCNLVLHALNVVVSCGPVKYGRFLFFSLSLSLLNRHK